jgi:hypothetical protein
MVEIEKAGRTVAAWRDWLAENGLANSSVRRKLTVLRSLFSYLQTTGTLARIRPTAISWTLPPFVAIDPLKGNIVPYSILGVIFPDGGLNAT